MNTFSSGKISRLPAHIREDLNRRLEQNIPAGEILPWLNALPEVRALLKDHFQEAPINAQNLSNWRRRGFLEWQHRTLFFDLLRETAEDAADIEATVGSIT